MEQSPETFAVPVSRTQIAIRLLYTVLFLFVLGILLFLIKLTTVFQYVLLLVTLSSSEPVRRFANQLTAYAYRVMRYLTLNDNERPFPFTEFPKELEPSVSEVKFD
jgi:D-alanyl-lipoteichoic acid acyltransferase DltB (MBOAT superfamily)